MAGCMARRRRELGLHLSNRRTYETPPSANPAGFQLPEWARRDSNARPLAPERRPHRQPTPTSNGNRWMRSPERLPTLAGAGDIWHKDSHNSPGSERPIGPPAEPDGICDGASVAVPVAAWMNGRKSSIGIGKIVTELFSAAISVTVWR